MTRPDVAADCFLLQKGSDELSVAELKEVNSTLRYLKATADAFFKINHIDPASLILVPYGDASWANAPGGKSQGGLLIAATHEKALKGEADASLLWNGNPTESRESCALHLPQKPLQQTLRATTPPSSDACSARCSSPTTRQLTVVVSLAFLCIQSRIAGHFTMQYISCQRTSLRSEFRSMSRASSRPLATCDGHPPST